MARQGLVPAAVAATFLAGCEMQSRERELPPASPDSVAEWNRVTDSATGAWAVKPTRDDLSCEPVNLGPDSTLILQMRTPHGASLYIGGPHRTLYLVVFHGQGQRDRAARKSLMAPQAFAELRELRLKVGTLSGGVWEFGRDTNEVVFREPGMYRVRVGNDMETDGPDYAECLVTFDPSR
jgi:hypothetical protein